MSHRPAAGRRVWSLIGVRASAVWLGLVTATAISFALGTDQGFGVRASTLSVLVIAIVKVRYVGLDFMELRTAPRVLRVVFQLWAFAVGALLIVLYATSR